MIARRTDDSAPRDPDKNRTRDEAVETSTAKASVHEAIGKLIGDDAACEQGHDDQDAVRPQAAKGEKTRRR